MYMGHALLMYLRYSNQCCIWHWEMNSNMVVVWWQTAQMKGIYKNKEMQYYMQ